MAIGLRNKVICSFRSQSRVSTIKQKFDWWLASWWEPGVVFEVLYLHNVSCSVKGCCDNPGISIPIWRGIERVGYDAFTKVETLFKKFLCFRSSEEKLLYDFSGLPAVRGMPWYRRLERL